MTAVAIILAIGGAAFFALTGVALLLITLDLIRG